MDSEQIYDEFMKRYQAYPQKLAEVVQDVYKRGEFPENIEDENYNSGTMGKPASSNIVVMNAVSFRQSFDDYKRQNPQMSDTEAKARVVFDFLNQNGVQDLSYEKDKDEVVFDYDKNTKITREQFYAGTVYEDSQTNTNFFDKHVGNVQLVSIKPRKTTNVPQKCEERFKEMPEKERFEIVYKRGLYHESVHTALGTTDERKCDAFALLKMMREHPIHAEIIHDIYKQQRSTIGYTLSRLYGKDDKSRRQDIQGGTMTYIMPNTYKKLEAYAKNPFLIPISDLEILKLSCELTREPEFSKEQLAEFAKLMRKEKITPQDLAENKIIRSCMKQGGFDSIDKYISSDKRLNAYFGVKPPNIPLQTVSQSPEEGFILPFKISHVRGSKDTSNAVRLAQIKQNG